MVAGDMDEAVDRRDDLEAVVRVDDFRSRLYVFARLAAESWRRTLLGQVEDSWAKDGVRGGKALMPDAGRAAIGETKISIGGSVGVRASGIVGEAVESDVKEVLCSRSASIVG